MEKSEKIYDDLKLETYFDPSKDGYWLVIKGNEKLNKEQHFFFEKDTLNNFTGLSTEEFTRKMNNQNRLVLFAATGYQISPYNIMHALEETKKIEDSKLEESLKSTKQ